MLYIIVETFKDAPAVYRRFRQKGRLAPDGLNYINSWVTPDVTRCYQVMECGDRRLLDEWLANWRDIVDFEVVPVITSSEAAEKMR